jgi:aspartate-semialdehyde dehydrogenase
MDNPLFQSQGRTLPANPRVAIVGATGAVGVELLTTLAARGFPAASLRLLASERSAGKRMTFGGRELTVEALGPESFAGADLALFSAGASVSRSWAAEAVAAGAIVVDNSSAFRMAPDVPLVVPEVNGDAIARHTGIIANPNCVSIIMTVALAPLHRAQPILRIQAATYQAASGAGGAAMAELRDATEVALAGQVYEPRVLRHPYAFNLFSHDTAVDAETLHNGEELKVMAETRRILDASMPIGVTCIRVPVLRAHAMALSVGFAKPMAPARARALLAAAEGVRIVDDPETNHFPMPNEAQGQGLVLAGRIRQDFSDPSGRTVSLFLAGDQLLKGAALNAVQIAERLLPR